MTHIYRKGDKAVVTINKEDGDGYSLVGDLGWIHRECLEPLPPAISPQAQAVLDAALSAIAGVPTRYDLSEKFRPLWDAVNAYRATIAPPDPMGDALKALRAEFERFCAGAVWVDGVRDAIDAVERARQP